TVFKDQRKLSAEGLRVAIALAENKPLQAAVKVNNGKIDVPSFLLTPVIVDKNNIDSELVKSGYLKKEDVYKFRK
ncbi:MAG: ATPase, partial [Bdellovibrionota bacterium]